MRIAIVGAGFCAVALAYYLLQDKSCKVDLFDPKGLGGEASGLATGLLHPYAGEQVRRSWMADAALEATNELLRIAEEKLKAKVFCPKGIIRKVQTEAQTKTFKEHIQTYRDIEMIDDKNFLLLSGATVFANDYLKGLFLACQEKGAVLHTQRIENFNELKSYDAVVLAAGGGLLEFEECKSLPIKCVKGQVLTCRLTDDFPPLDHSIIAKGYIAKSPDPRIIFCGSTYEHGFLKAEPDIDFAISEIMPKIEKILPKGAKLDVVDCRAAFRVTAVGHYFPIVRKIKENCYVMGAMGSRGLLYHALLAKLLSRSILTCDESYLPNEVKISLCKKTSMH